MGICCISVPYWVSKGTTLCQNNCTISVDCRKLCPMSPKEFELIEVIQDSINRELLEELIQTRMPYGRFRGDRLLDLPEPYLVWFKQQGFPDGKLGRQLASLYEIKVYGLEKMLRPLLNEAPQEPEQLVIRF